MFVHSRLSFCFFDRRNLVDYRLRQSYQVSSKNLLVHLLLDFPTISIPRSHTASTPPRLPPRRSTRSRRCLTAPRPITQSRLQLVPRLCYTFILAFVLEYVATGSGQGV